MANERTGLFQLPRKDPEAMVRRLAGSPVDQLLAPGLNTDDDGRMMVDHDDTLEVVDGKLSVSNRDSYLFNVAYGGY